MAPLEVAGAEQMYELVLLAGALFGAALGPLVIRALFVGKDLELDMLVIPWFAATVWRSADSCSR